MILPGDFLTHDFRENYMLYASDKSDAAYRSFVLKTIRYVAMGLKARFPDVPVVATLGNNDSFCGDYQIEPSSEFLYDLTATMAEAAGNPAGFSAYPELGAYVIPHPGPLAIISWCWKTRSCLPSTGTPAGSLTPIRRKPCCCGWNPPSIA